MITAGQNVDLRRFVMDLPPRLCQSLMRCTAAWEAAQQFSVPAHDQVARLAKLQAVCRGWLFRQSRRRAARKEAALPLGRGNEVDDDEAVAVELAAVTIQRIMRGALCRAKRGPIADKEMVSLQKQVCVCPQDFKILRPGTSTLTAACGCRFAEPRKQRVSMFDARGAQGDHVQRDTRMRPRRVRRVLRSYSILDKIGTVVISRLLVMEQQITKQPFLRRRGTCDPPGLLRTHVHPLRCAEATLAVQATTRA